MAKELHTGILKVYDPIKGYGFITRPAGRDVFVFYSDFEKNEDASALIGTQVQFEIVEKPGGKGPKALNVKILG